MDLKMDQENSVIDNSLDDSGATEELQREELPPAEERKDAVEHGTAQENRDSYTDIVSQPPPDEATIGKKGLRAKEPSAESCSCPVIDKKREVPRWMELGRDILTFTLKAFICLIFCSVAIFLLRLPFKMGEAAGFPMLLTMCLLFGAMMFVENLSNKKLEQLMVSNPELSVVVFMHLLLWSASF